MAECKDCYNIRVNIFMDMGNGKCDECRGTGLGDGFDQFTSNLVNEKSKCKKCKGSGKCQTCNGKGIID